MSSISHLSAFYLKIKPTIEAIEVRRRFENEQNAASTMTESNFTSNTAPSHANGTDTKKYGKQNSDATPKRWSAPQDLGIVAFNLGTILDESVASKKSPTPAQQPELNDSAKQKFIDCLENYCSDILKFRKDNFVDLKDFKEEEFSVTLDELEEAKRNAEKIAKVTDHAGLANVHVNDAIEAGVLAFVESQVLTRKRARQLQESYNLDSLLYEGIPERSVSKFANKVRSERDSRIVETYVDFKTELKTKHEVLERVEVIQKLDKLNELPAIKRLRKREDSENEPKRPRRANCSANEFRTPPSVLKKKFNPLDYNNIMDDFLDNQAREFVDENKMLAKRRKSLAPAQLFD